MTVFFPLLLIAYFECDLKLLTKNPPENTGKYVDDACKPFLNGQTDTFCIRNTYKFVSVAHKAADREQNVQMT